jgi:hypothetical protein
VLLRKGRKRRRASIVTATRRGGQREEGAEGMMEGDAMALGKARGLLDVPFELVGKVASACTVAEARDVERGAAAARHGVS